MVSVIVVIFIYSLTARALGSATTTASARYALVCLYGLACNDGKLRMSQHYVKLYESGEIKDCNSPHCALSKAHCHPAGSWGARRCTCSKVRDDKTIHDALLY
jgi:hypothetical protein